MKKLMTTLSMVLALGLGTGFMAGCDIFNPGPQEINKQEKVMNLSLNPRVEFVLSEDDKVITVNALNEEGNLIISAEAFENIEGKTAEEAAKLFVQVSSDTGYLVQGSAAAGDNQISISFSGDQEVAEDLYEEVEGKMKEYLESVDVTVNIQMSEEIKMEHLKALLAVCEPNLDTSEMTYEQLVDALEQSRKETAEFYSQQLKNAYYEAKEFAMQMAELETLRGHLNTIQQLAFDVMTQAYEKAVELIEKTRRELLVDEDSLYQRALGYFRELKVTYLKTRNEFSIGDATITVEITEEELAKMKAQVEKAEEAFIQAAEDANKSLDTLKGKVTESYNKAIEKLNEYSVKADDYLVEISNKQKEKQTEFFTAFETNYKTYIEGAEKQWTDMETELEGEGAQEVQPE